MPTNRYWLDERRGYVPLSEFPALLLATREAEGSGWERRHPHEPTVDELARDVAERWTGMPAYLVDDEIWAEATAEAAARLRGEKWVRDGSR